MDMKSMTSDGKNMIENECSEEDACSRDIICDNEAPAPDVRCPYCGQTISSSAKFCSNCNHYKSLLLNAIRYYAPPIMFVLGALLWVGKYTYQFASEVHETNRDLVSKPILEDTNTFLSGRSFLTNAGETTVLYKSLHFRCETLQRSMNLDLKISMIPGEVKQVPHGQTNEHTEFAFGVSKEEAIKAFENNDPNFSLGYVSKSSPLIPDLKSGGVPMFDATVEMHFRVLNTGEQKHEPYSVTAVVMVKKKPEINLIGQWLASPSLERPKHLVLDIQIVNNYDKVINAHCVNLSVIANGVPGKGVRTTKTLVPTEKYYGWVPEDLVLDERRDIPVLISQEISPGESDRFQVVVYLPTCFSHTGRYYFTGSVETTAGPMEFDSMQLAVASELVAVEKAKEL